MSLDIRGSRSHAPSPLVEDFDLGQEVVTARLAALGQRVVRVRAGDRGHRERLDVLAAGHDPQLSAAVRPMPILVAVNVPSNGIGR